MCWTLLLLRKDMKLIRQVTIVVSCFWEWTPEDVLFFQCLIHLIILSLPIQQK